MFDSESRYLNLPNAKFTAADGREIIYKTRRFLPRGNTKQELGRLVVNQGERLDQIANQAYGNSKLYWRVADANDVLNPTDLLREPGKVIRVPVPDFT